MKKVLTVVYDDILTDPRASKFKKSLSELYSVTTLSLALIDGERVPGDYAYKSKGGRFVKLFMFWFCIIKVCMRVRPDIIVAHNYYVVFPCMLVSKIFKAKFVYDSYEFYVPQRGVKFPLRSYFFFYQEYLSIKKADLVFSANRERARLMKGVYRLRTLPIPILNTPISQSATDIKQKDTETFMIVYEGVMALGRHLAFLMDILRFLPDNYSIKFIGNGPDFEKLKEMADKHPNKDRITFVGRLSTSEIMPQLAMCDLGFVGYSYEGLNNIYCSPNKIYEYPAAGIPFISTNHSPIYSITHDYHICEFFNPQKDSAEDIARNIIEMSQRMGYYKELIPKFNADHTWKAESEKVISAFEKL